MTPSIMLVILLTCCSIVISNPAEKQDNREEESDNVIKMNIDKGQEGDKQPVDAPAKEKIADDEEKWNTVVNKHATDQEDEPADRKDNEAGTTTASQKNYRKEIVDWGLPEDKKKNIDSDFAGLQQLHQQQEQEKLNEKHEKQNLEEKKEHKGTETEKEGNKEKEQEDEDPQPHGDRKPEIHQKVPDQHDAHRDIGILRPEHLVHGDDSQEDHHAAGRSTPSKNGTDQAEFRFQSENAELNEARPRVPVNVHDGTARKIADFMKHQQFGPDEPDEILHGGQHAHGAKVKGRPLEPQAGDGEAAAHGMLGAHEHDNKDDDKVPLSIDPDELMHQGQGHVHSKQPEAVAPVDKILPGHEHGKKHDDQNEEKGVIGVEYETIIHDGQHVHHGNSDQAKPKNRVKYQDIIDLNLSEELLKGIDLSKLLEQEKKEMEEWHRETESRKVENGSHLSDTERSAEFWQKQVTDLRKTYLEKLYAKVRHISNPNLENAEWDEDDDNVRGVKDRDAVHEGETKMEQDMEAWASTISKGGRKPYRVMQEQGAKQGENDKEGEEKMKIEEGKKTRKVENGKSDGAKQNNKGSVVDEKEKVRRTLGGVKKENGQTGNDL